jgi:hypothetical protein
MLHAYVTPIWIYRATRFGRSVPSGATTLRHGRAYWSAVRTRPSPGDFHKPGTSAATPSAITGSSGRACRPVSRDRAAFDRRSAAWTSCPRDNHRRTVDAPSSTGFVRCPRIGFLENKVEQRLALSSPRGRASIGALAMAILHITMDKLSRRKFSQRRKKLWQTTRRDLNTIHQFQLNC